jgi:hypothetical protein
MSKETCGTCRFFSFETCCRYPPVRLFDGDDVDTFWPTVDPVDDWCGEYQPKTPEASTVGDY